jgi:DNA ligase (NAD+)
MSIRKTTPADLENVMEIYAYARQAMKEAGNPHQWGDRHPNRTLIEEDIRTGLSYVYENDGNIAAVFYFNIAAEPTYTHIDGQWLNDKPYGVVHRIARTRNAKGAGAFCLEWCFAQCHNLRIDTHVDNKPMIKVLERLGYTYCGVIRLGLFENPEWDKRNAYQKHSPIPRMRELAAILQKASRAYYHENRELMTDREYDALYDELTQLEAESGTVLASSPTQKVGYEVVSVLNKVAHAVPMLSLDKTKDPEALAAFLGEHEGLLTWKLDGLALAMTYENGALTQALTRGNGLVGEDVTHNARVFVNLPVTVAHKERLTVRGEAVITYADFSAINAALLPEEAYKNPRNLCSGTVRQLNSQVAAGRKVRFYAIGTSENETSIRHTKSLQLQWLEELGFETVTHKTVIASTVVETVEDFKKQISAAQIATDGLVLTFNDIAYGMSLGATSKFPRDSVAFKWADELQETTLLDIEWNTSRTGLINPVAIFAPVELEGTSVSRASVHNVSILRELDLHVGDRITVYKANMIIPQVAENLSRDIRQAEGMSLSALDAYALDLHPSKTGDAPASGRPASERSSREDASEGIPSARLAALNIPASCPVCEGPTEIVSGPSGESLYCIGANCSAQRLRALSHFVSRDALNIEGLSEQKLEKLIALGIIDNYPDLFDLQRHEDEIVNMEGFGKKSYDNLIKAIETAKDIALPNFIYALGIRHVGLANAKLLCAHFSHNMEKIKQACIQESPEGLLEIKGFGEAIAASLFHYFTNEENITLLDKTLPRLRLKTPTEAPAERPLADLTFVITGEVYRYKNRKELQNFIESQGGKVTGSVTAKTSYLINNDAASASGKNKKAAELGVPVLTEEEFVIRFNALL